MSAGSGEVRFNFPPLERRGVILGLRGGPLATMVGGAVAAVGALRVLHGVPGVVAALVLLAGVTAIACWPLGGQALVCWIPTVTAWLHRRQGQPHLDRAPLDGAISVPATVAVAPPTAGGRACRSASVRGQGGRPAEGRSEWRRSPTAPAGLRLMAAPSFPGEPEIGVVEDLVARSWAAVLPVKGSGLSLLGAHEQRRRLGAWGAALAGAARAGSAVRRLQWVEQSRPADPVALQRSALMAAGPEAARDSYLAVVDAEAPSALDRRAYLVVSVRSPGALRLRPMPMSLLNDMLRREVRLLRGQMCAAELEVGEALDPGALSATLRAACDPTRPARAGTGPGLASPLGAWPAAVDERWAALRVDGAWQATYWVSEWPRLPVGPDVLGPLLLGGTARTVAVTMAPIQADRAVREVQSARTAALADEALRSRAGFIDTVQRRREAEGIRRRESELAEGHADYRYSGYVAVWGATPDLLAEACAEVEQAARQSHLVLRRLYGRQAEARAWTLPVGRGLS